MRGGRTETLEGGWAPKRLVVLEFPTVEKAREFYHSEDYAPALKMRLAASKSRALIVEGA